MDTVFARVMGMFAITGSATALLMVLNQLGTLKSSFAAYAIVAVYLGVALLGLVAGVLLIERDRRSRKIVLWFWAIQVPILLLPGIGHQLGIGAFAYLWLEVTGGWGWFIGFGSHFKSHLFRFDVPITIGINLAALLLFALSYFALRRQSSVVSPDR